MGCLQSGNTAQMFVYNPSHIPYFAWYGKTVYKMWDKDGAGAGAGLKIPVAGRKLVRFSARAGS